MIFPLPQMAHLQIVSIVYIKKFNNCIFSGFTTFSQVLIDKNTFLASTGGTISVGDDITIGVPANYSYEFSFIENNTKNKVGIAGKLAGVATTVGVGAIGLGAVNGSYGAAKAGAKVAVAAATAEEISDGSEAVLGHNHELTGRKMRILKFKKEGNSRRGEYIYAIVAGPKQQNYKIELPLAIQSKEITVVNGRQFYVSQ